MGSFTQITESRKGMRGALIFVGFWSLIVLIFDTVITIDIFQQIRALQFATTSGTITQSQVQSRSDSDGTTYAVDIKYNYTVAGVNHTGTQYRFSQWSSNDGSAKRIVDSLPVGARVPVYYDPADPTVAVLRVGIAGSDLFMLLFLTPFNLVMLTGWWLVGRGIIVRIRGTTSNDGPDAWLDRQNRPRIRLPAFSPLGVFAITVGLGSFLCIFIVAFGWGFDAPLHVLRTVWICLFSLGLLAALKKARWTASGRSDLIVDPREQTIHLPTHLGADVTVPLDRLGDIDVQEKVRRSDDSTSVSYIVTVHYKDEVGRPQQVELPVFTNEGMARDTAAWIKGYQLDPWASPDLMLERINSTSGPSARSSD